MLLQRFGSIFLAGVVALGCTAPDDMDDAVPGGNGKEDQIAWFDDPTTLLPNAKTLLKDIIVAGDVGKDFGVDDDRIPYPDTYWPMVDDGIDVDWNGDGTPLGKYMQLFDASHLDEAKKWEKKNHGSEVPDVASWFGHCPGWTGSALVNAPLKHAIHVKADGGDVAKCSAGSAGCVKMEIGDINALQAEVFNDGDSAFIGARCDTAPDKIKRDRNGRILRDGSNGEGCKGLNPGSLLIVAGNLMKGQHKPFAIDAQNEANTDQIWNQPAYRYHVYRFEHLTQKEAANLVAFGKKTGTRVNYTWNTEAKGFVLVDLGLFWVSETSGPNTEMVSGAEQTQETRMVAVIELSAAPTDAKARIIGGEYLNDESVDANRLKVPPFVWTSRGPGPERPRGDDGHNPFVKPSIVMKLVAMAQE